MKNNSPAQSRRGSNSGFTIPEVLVATSILAIAYIGLYGAMAFGRTMIKNSRENLRATEIMDQRMEQIRLYDWQQVTNNTGPYCYMNPAPFPQYYDSSHTNNPPVYWCTTTVGNVPTNYPTSYSADMRVVTIVVRWTNYNGGESITSHERTNQTYVAHFGLQNYIY